MSRSFSFPTSLSLTLSGTLVATALASCSHGTNAWHGHAETRKIPDESQRTVDGKYSQYGHQTTTYIVARIAGWKPVPAMRLSHFSQAPDEMAFRYSAPAVAVWGSAPGLWSYRHRIVAILHSLHGGDADAVIHRRATLHDLIASSAKGTQANDWETGFLIHAMGDSYAHVKPGPDRRDVAYGELVGHGFDHDVKPDHISPHFPTYKAYVTSLHSALAIDGGDPKELKRFLDHVEEMATRTHESVREEAVKDAITGFRPYSEVGSEIETADLKPSDYARWDKEVRNVNGFLKRIDRTLK